MKKIAISSLLLFLLLSIAGCVRVEHDITINKDFSGQSLTKIIPNEGIGITVDDIKKILAEQGVTNAEVKAFEETVNNEKVKGFVIKSEWKNIDEMKLCIGNMTPKIKNNENKTITLDFGRNNAQKTVIHFPGTLEQNGTSGKLLDKNTVEFSEGQPMLITYSLPTWQWLIWVVVSLVVLVVMIVLAIVWKKKKTKDKVINANSM